MDKGNPTATAPTTPSLTGPSPPLPHLSSHVTSENLRTTSKSSISKCQIACISVAHTSVHKAKTTLVDDNFFPVSSDEKPLALTKYKSSNTLPFLLENENSLPKPKLLEDLENFLEKELQILNVKERQYNELTFLAHREVFEYLIDNFKTYKPLLSRIKKKYEIRINQLKKQIHLLQPLKQMTATTPERYEHKIMALRELDKQRLIDLKAQNKDLLEKLTSLHRSEYDILYSIERLKKEIEDLDSDYLQQVDERMYIVTKMNDLRLQIEKLEETKSQRQENPKEDPATIRLAIKEAREREKVASQKINEILADYTDLLPETQFAELEEKYNTLNENREKILNEFKTLKNKHGDLLNIHSKLAEDRNYYYIECEKLKKTEIAMDHWNNCIDYINGGPTSWQEVSSSAASQSLLEILHEMIDQNRSNIAIISNTAAEITTYNGMGLKDDVPKFLRYEGKIEGYQMLTRDCYLMISDIWAKRGQDEQKPLIEFVHDYLQENIPDPNERIKWAYTFNSACQKLAPNHENINLFMEILNDNVDESVYYARQKMASDLLQSLQETEKKRPAPKEKGKDDSLAAEQLSAGFLSREEFTRALVQFFDISSEEDESFLVKAAAQQLQSTGNIEYEQLFMLDEEGELGPFLTIVKDWQQNIQTEFINQLRQFDYGGSINEAQLKKILEKNLPHLNASCINRLVKWVFKGFTDPDAALVDTDVFDRLNATFLPLKKQI